MHRYPYTAIDDAARVRGLKVYRRHTQANAIDFIDYFAKKFPFRIRTIRTDRGHEFQALFHWHVADLGMEHVYIKPRTPPLNGKVERSHKTDNDEFYQLLTYRDDVDLEKIAGRVGALLPLRSAARSSPRQDTIRGAEREATIDEDVLYSDFPAKWSTALLRMSPSSSTRRSSA